MFRSRLSNEDVNKMPLRPDLLRIFCIVPAGVMFVACSPDATEEESGAVFVEATSPSGSTIQPYTPIIVKLDGIPVGLSCYSCAIEDGTVSETVDLSHSGKLSQDGEIITITGPFKSGVLGISLE